MVKVTIKDPVWRGLSSTRLHRPVAQPLRGGAARGDLRTVLHSHEQLRVVERLDCVDKIQIDEVRAMHPYEARRIEALLEIGEWQADEQRLAHVGTRT